VRVRRLRHLREPRRRRVALGELATQLPRRAAALGARLLEVRLRRKGRDRAV
jgi:hypothetical protein